jgi:uncharacterized protein
MALYNNYIDFLRQKYSFRVQKITVDAGFSCPNRDGQLGHRGCIYCNNESFAPTHLRGKSITAQVEHGIEIARRRYKKVEKYLVYFQSFSNTYGPLPRLQELYSEALAYPQVIGLSIGTRPDCVDEPKIAYLQELAQKYDITLEYGLESIRDETLQKIGRGHDLQTFRQAIELTQNRGIQIAVHLIIGFPWETVEDWVAAARFLSQLPIQFVKLHQLHIVRHTPLGEEYLRKSFPLLTLEQYLEALRLFLENLRADIVIQRLYGEAPPHLLIAPDWNLELNQFHQLLDAYLLKHQSHQGKLLLSQGIQA